MFSGSIHADPSSTSMKIPDYVQGTAAHQGPQRRYHNPHQFPHVGENANVRDQVYGETSSLNHPESPFILGNLLKSQDIQIVGPAYSSVQRMNLAKGI